MDKSKVQKITTSATRYLKYLGSTYQFIIIWFGLIWLMFCCAGNWFGLSWHSNCTIWLIWFEFDLKNLVLWFDLVWFDLKKHLLVWFEFDLIHQMLVCPSLSPANQVSLASSTCTASPVSLFGTNTLLEIRKLDKNG